MRPLPAAGEFTGTGVVFFVPHLDDLAGHNVVIVGGGDSAFDWALSLAKGEHVWKDSTPLPWEEETARFFETLERYPQLQIEVQGHTDTRGSDRYNLRLSQERAESVRQFLIDHFHLDADHLVAKGYGETQPETRERNDEEMLRNRRVELHVMNPEALPRGTKVEEGK